MNKPLISILFALYSIPAALAQSNAFHAGSFIADFGPIATVQSDVAIPENTTFKLSFDVVGHSDAEINRSFVSAARFLNMHVEAGVKSENIELAIVIHGKATLDATNNAYYEPLVEFENPNIKLIKALVDKGVQIIVCGQSAAHLGVANKDLLPGVKMALSAMTAHAMLQQQGYTLNPF